MKVTYLQVASPGLVTARELLELKVPGRMVYWNSSLAEDRHRGGIWKWEHDKFSFPCLEYLEGSNFFIDNKDTFMDDLEEMAFEPIL